MAVPTSPDEDCVALTPELFSQPGLRRSCSASQASEKAPVVVPCSTALDYYTNYYTIRPGSSSLIRTASVDEQNLASDVGRPVRGQKRDCIRDVFGLSDSPQRDLVEDLFLLQRRVRISGLE